MAHHNGRFDNQLPSQSAASPKRSRNDDVLRRDSQFLPSYTPGYGTSMRTHAHEPLQSQAATRSPFETAKRRKSPPLDRTSSSSILPPTSTSWTPDEQHTDDLLRSRRRRDHRAGQIQNTSSQAHRLRDSRNLFVDQHILASSSDDLPFQSPFSRPRPREPPTTDGTSSDYNLDSDDNSAEGSSAATNAHSQPLSFTPHPAGHRRLASPSQVQSTDTPDPLGHTYNSTMRTQKRPYHHPSTSSQQHASSSSSSSSSSRPNKRPRPTGHTNPQKDVEIVVLDMVDEGSAMDKTLQKQREEQIASQMGSELALGSKTLSEFQCIICLDEATDMTSTVCGHVFCHKCLMDALTVNERRGSPSGTKKGQCPVCRKVISRRSVDVIPLAFFKGRATQPRRAKQKTPES